MIERSPQGQRSFGLVQVIAITLAILGIVLTSHSWWFIMLTAMGAFGPGILREAGWLQDQDEFQRRAGYHAFLVSGVLMFLCVAVVRSNDKAIDDPQELATLFLSCLWCTWFFSSLLSFWGPKKTAERVLYSFGTAWFLFAVAGTLAVEWGGWVELLLSPLLSAPFFLAASFVPRMPRRTGVVLLGIAVFFVWFFGLFQRDNFSLVTQGVTFILFVGPLLASGLALLLMRRSSDD